MKSENVIFFIFSSW